MHINEISHEVIGAAIAVHRELGPGLLESVYEHCLAYELDQRGITFRRQLPMTVRYKGVDIDAGYRLDLLVEDQVVVELKTVEQFERVHFAQLLTYLKLTGKHLGLLINFNAAKLAAGIRRVALDLAL